MLTEWIRQVCLSFPGTTEAVQWEDHLVFKVGGKSYVITSFTPGGNTMSFKAAASEFSELIERPGLVPAPYLARAKWVAMEHDDALTRTEIKELLRKAYDEVVSKLPKKTRASLSQ